MGIVKISEELHEEVRRASGTMVRSINAQAEFWMKMGMLAELNPGLTYTELLRQLLQQAVVPPVTVNDANLRSASEFSTVASTATRVSL